MAAEEKRHRWLGAAEVVIPGVSAERAASRGRFVIPAAVVVTIQDVYCERCRVSYTPRYAKLPCKIGPQHVGGPRRREDEEAALRLGA